MFKPLRINLVKVYYTSLLNIRPEMGSGEVGCQKTGHAPLNVALSSSRERYASINM
jgi:hypothetical protein